MFSMTDPPSVFLFTRAFSTAPGELGGAIAHAGSVTSGRP
jgi:hypothetical protein